MRIPWTAAAAIFAVLLALGVDWIQPRTAPVPPQDLERDRPPTGFWSPAPEHGKPTPGEQQQLIARLEAIGYATGTLPATRADRGGVHASAYAHPGPKLYVSGHAPEARLIDATGRELHRWQFPVERVFPDLPAERIRDSAYFRRAYAYPNGDLLAIFEGIGILKLDRDSRLLWSSANGAHHAADILGDGSIYLLTRTAHVVPAVDPTRPTLEDFIVELSPDGRERRRVSLLQALLASDYAAVATRIDPRLPARNRVHAERGDLFHTNSIQVLRATHPTRPAFRRGRVLVSSRHLGAVMLIDLEAGTVPWLHRGDFLTQHEARVLTDTPDWSLLLFDNNTRERGSRALELSLDGQTLWQYPDERSRERIYSGCCGTVSRLPNGNTLVVVTAEGRALEITPGHRVVWEFESPHRAGEGGRLIAALFDLAALPSDFPLDWIPSPADSQPHRHHTEQALAGHEPRSDTEQESLGPARSDPVERGTE